MSFFSSRWVSAPDGVSELPLDSELPAGFRAAGVAAGIKPSGRPDVALLVCDEPDAVSAVRLTATAAPAAPVQLTAGRTDRAALRGILINSGCANAATGKRGLEDAAKCQGAAAAALALAPEQVAVASTGAIAHSLPVDLVLRGILAARGELSGAGGAAMQAAIETTDRTTKRAELAVQLEAGTVRIAAQCKGAGMISPNFATMLCFVQTDALLDADTADLLFGVCVQRSFERISVDGQLSTNDTAILIASGASGVRIEPESADERLFGEALDALLRQLALMIVADGEGAARIARVHVLGSAAGPVEAVARAVANSPLVKTALHGGDPNWGRIVQAAGGALAGAGDVAVDVWIEGIKVCGGGAALSYDEQALAGAVVREEVEYRVQLPGEGAETEVFFSDLSHDYVTLNAEYTT